MAYHSTIELLDELIVVYKNLLGRHDQRSHTPTRNSRVSGTMEDDARLYSNFNEFVNSTPRCVSVRGKTAESISDPITYVELTYGDIEALKRDDPTKLVSGKFWTARRGGVARRKFRVSLIDFPDDLHKFWLNMFGRE